MNILIAPNSFKNNLPAWQICNIIEKAFQAVSNTFKIEKLPLADGGDGTLQVLTSGLSGKYIKKETINADAEKRIATYFLSNQNVAYIELAEASGLKSIMNLNPETATTYGTGELIADAISKGAKKIILGIGGSATIDAGVGAAMALGIKFLGINGKPLYELNDILDFCTDIDDSNAAAVRKIEMDILCDVKNPAFGKEGGIKVYGSQKGGTPKFLNKREAQIKRFDKMLQLFLDKKWKDNEFLGASGGFPVTFQALFNTKLFAGAEYIFNYTNLEEKIKLADVIITAEGQYDKQTLNGKLPFEVAKRAKKHKKPIVLLTGQTSFWDNTYFDAIFPVVNKPGNLDNLLLESEKLLFETSRQVALFIHKISSKNG